MYELLEKVYKNSVKRLDESMVGMTGGMAKYWIIPRVGDKELPRVGH